MLILIIEDDPVARSLVEEHLAKAGYTTRSAASVRAAVAHLESAARADLIICDIMLPDQNGLVFVNWLRRDRRYNKIPVLMCSALRDEDMVRQSLQLGVLDYMAKPIHPATLLEKVGKALEKSIHPILLVDESDIVLEHIERTLQRNGYSAIKASSGDEAVKLMEANKVTAVISGALPHGMSGFDLLIEVKSRDPLIPVLMITDRDGMAQKLDVMSEGADGYVVKPFSNLDLVNRLEHCIRRSRTRRID